MTSSFSSPQLVDDLERVSMFLLIGRGGNLYVGNSLNNKSTSNLSDGVEIERRVSSLLAGGKGLELLAEIRRSKCYGANMCAIVNLLAACSLAPPDDLKTKTAALNALDSLCSTPDDLFAFVQARELMCKKLNDSTGWGRALRRAVKNWYVVNRTPLALAALCVNHRMDRNGWTHRDIIRLAHVSSKNVSTAVVIRYLTHGLETVEREFGSEKEMPEEVKQILKFLNDFHHFKTTKDESEAAHLIEKHSFSYESVPRDLKKSSEVLRRIVVKLPLEQLVTSLKRFGKMGCLSPKSPILSVILDQLKCEDKIAASKLHPIVVYAVLRKYEDPVKLKRITGDIRSTVTPSIPPKPRRPPLPTVVNALNSLITATIKHYPVTGKRYLIALDVRNQMAYSKVYGFHRVTAANAAALIIQPLLKAESDRVTLVAFGPNDLTLLHFKADMALAHMTRQMRQTPMGPVNCAKPMLWAKEMKWPYDAFIILTDTQTDIVDVKPSEALRQFRINMDLPKARVVICALSRKKIESVDDGPGLLYVAGLDCRAPRIIHEFIANSTNA